jgi:hypothetical protein
MNVELRRRRDLGRILDDSFALYRDNWRTLVLVALVVVVPVHLLVFGVGLGWLWSGYPTASDGVGIGSVGDQLAGTAAQLLVVTPLVTAMTVHVVLAAAMGRRARAAETFSAGLEVFAGLFVAVILVAAGVIMGLLLLVIPGVILAVRWVVVPQAVVIEGRRGTDALTRSLELTRGQGWFTLLVLVVANLLVSFVSALALVPLEYAAKEADSMAFSLLGQAIGAILTLPLLAVAYTLLYYSLLATREGPAPGPAGSPLPGVPGTYGDGWAPPAPPRR